MGRAFARIQPVLILLTVCAAGFVGGSLRAESLAIDFNDRSNDLPANTDEDFDSFIIGNAGGNTAVQFSTNSLQYATLTVSVSDILGVGGDDRKRGTPVNTGSFTEAQLLHLFPGPKRHQWFEHSGPGVGLEPAMSGHDLVLRFREPGRSYFRLVCQRHSREGQLQFRWFAASNFQYTISFHV